MPCLSGCPGHRRRPPAMRNVLAALRYRCLAVRAIALGVASAQDYPARPVKIVVPFPAGGGTDALTRFLARGLEAASRPAVHRREPRRRGHHARRHRGRSLGARRLHHHARHGLRPSRRARASTSASPTTRPRTFRRSCCWRTVPFVLVVNPSLGVNSVKELIALAKSKPGELDFASAGVGAVHQHLLRTVHDHDRHRHEARPYRGGGPALNDVVAGHVPIISAMPGRRRPLMRRQAQGARRHDRQPTNLPDVPTLD